MPEITCLFLVLEGRVQGVGFRPFVYREAQRRGISGWVRNRTGRVEVLAQGEAASLEAFAEVLTEQAPPLARPRLVERVERPPEPLSGFEIVESASGDAKIHVPPDHFACPQCVAEMCDPVDRRYRYPFINCTQCGPRYTLIDRLPYDRPNTSMAGFALCTACSAEYHDPADRRFHAQPVACPECGPQIQFFSREEKAERGAALSACIEALREGHIVAVKGIGGYHLMCDARNQAAVQRLRTRKRRPDKPLAVMFPEVGVEGLEALRILLAPSAAEASLLRNPMRPIVLVKKRRGGCDLADAIAPALDEVGAMLPYSPLHHLLLGGFGGPLVATSGNVSGEPVITDPGEADARLKAIADGFLHHDRPIRRPADDPVVRFIGAEPRTIRLGRGNAPLELDLPIRLPEPVLAVGGHLKNTVALAWEDRVVVSPHIGELDAPRSRHVFEQVIADLQRLYSVSATRIICDAHPDYASSRWARRSGLPVTPVFHHHAHASALYGEHVAKAQDADWLVFTWDGVGLGEDGTLWGGETLFGRPGAWRRVGSFRPFRLPGGDKAGREPWRSALALCWEAGIDWQPQGVDLSLLRQAWARGINSPTSTAAGRMFDAAAALVGLVEKASFEGQGPMRLEAAARQGEPIELPMGVDSEELLRVDWAPLLPLLADSRETSAARAGCFHASLARSILHQSLHFGKQFGVLDVGLTGGVFQNRRLSELAIAHLETAGFRVRLPAAIPCSDGGLSFGQVVQAAFLG